MSLRLILIFVVAMFLGGGVAFLLTKDGRNLTSGVIGTTGTALVGGPFSLTSHEGKPVTQDTYAGRHMLVFFGFTYCPDICPASLQAITAALEDMGDDANRITPLFVTVDPARDTPDVLKEYVGNFHPSIVGLTGTDAQIAATAKAYRAYYRKVKTGDGADEYTMDHSAFYYLMGPDGQFITHFNHGIEPAKLAAQLKARIGASS